MAPRSRHRTKPPAGLTNFGSLPASANSSGIGKKGSLAKNNLYSNQLPILNSYQPIQSSNNKNSNSKLNKNQKTTQGWLEWTTSFIFSSTSTSSHKEETKVIAHWDPLTNLVYVPIDQMELARKVLWQRGFFGKGNLSRSEPTWREREMGKEKVRRVRERGGIGQLKFDQIMANWI